ncbi:TetR/AcrR family transcriptional regulator [Pseudarthrobacter sp. J1738]|uniref:TetR/AcrR family transcriptional regulator n=1 Tax=unclassified Pseudarthrobacter TaxID=2647000 RepID=UPI003D2A519C
MSATDAPKSPRASAREHTELEILRIGRRHLTEHGAAALSLRAVARDLGVVSSAVYRYVASRDELLTLLLVDAYNELGDAVDAAVDALPESDSRDRFQAVGRAVRAWGLAKPSRYALLFGSPVPGYAAPAERTTVPGTRVVYRLIGILDAAHRKGELSAVASAAVVPSLARDMERICAELGLELPGELLARASSVWTGIFGAVSFEVFGQYGSGTFEALDELFEHHLNEWANSLGFPSK